MSWKANDSLVGDEMNSNSWITKEQESKVFEEMYSPTKQSKSNILVADNNERYSERKARNNNQTNTSIV